MDAGFDSGRYLPVCVNSPYLDELFIPQAREVAADYDVDEIFFDTMTGFRPCYCESCRAKFGEEIPSGPEDANWLKYVEWYSDAYEHFYRSTGRAVHEVNPEIAVTFNWEWGIRRPTPPPPEIDRLGADLIPSPTMASMQTRYFSSTGHPYDYMTGRFQHGLGDWNSTTRETLRVTAAATVANGGGFYIIDRQLPDGTLEERAYTAMQDVFGWLQKRRDYLVGAQPVPQIGVLYAYSHVMGPDLRYFPDGDARKERMKTFEGSVRLFMEHGRHFTVLNSETMTERAGDYPMVLVPEQEHLPQRAQGRPARLRRGGRPAAPHAVGGPGLRRRGHAGAGRRRLRGPQRTRLRLLRPRPAAADARPLRPRGAAGRHGAPHLGRPADGRRRRRQVLRPRLRAADRARRPPAGHAPPRRGRARSSTSPPRC